MIARSLLTQKWSSCELLYVSPSKHDWRFHQLSCRSARPAFCFSITGYGRNNTLLLPIHYCLQICIMTDRWTVPFLKFFQSGHSCSWSPHLSFKKLEIMQYCAQKIDSGQAWEAQKICRHRDGGRRWDSANAILLRRRRQFILRWFQVTKWTHHQGVKFLSIKPFFPPSLSSPTSGCVCPRWICHHDAELYSS